MIWQARVDMIKGAISKSRRHFAFSVVGLVVGASTLAFFLALSNGVQERVLNRLYPVNQVEFQAETVGLFGLGMEVPTKMDVATLTALEKLEGVTSVYPKQRAKFQARLWGGADVLGRDARVESFFDGIEPALIADELRQAEAAVLGPEILDLPCEQDSACGIGGKCSDGFCTRPTWWNIFADLGATAWCDNDDNCPVGMSCLAGRCRVSCDERCGDGQACEAGACVPICRNDSECNMGAVCLVSKGICEQLQCRLDDANDQLANDINRQRGTVVAPSLRAGQPCPEGTYCAAKNLALVHGTCEAPIPALISPFLLEVYNSMVATALGLKRLGGLQVVLGVNFAILFGESYFVADGPITERVVRRAKVVGFSPKAMEFGVTVPLPYVVRANAAQRGRQASAEYTSVVVETRHNEDVPMLVQDAKVLGLTLAPKSEEGRKAANVLLILTIVFAVVSLVILAISAINIAHTFMMLVTERRMEIAIYRSVGATLNDIRLLFLGEAAILGLVGGSLGVLLAWVMGIVVNAMAASVFAHIPGSPESLFSFNLYIVLVAIACAIIFALAGAWLPAESAAKTDPAMVLSQG